MAVVDDAGLAEQGEHLYQVHQLHARARALFDAAALVDGIRFVSGRVHAERVCHLVAPLIEHPLHVALLQQLRDGIVLCDREGDEVLLDDLVEAERERLALEARRAQQGAAHHSQPQQGAHELVLQRSAETSAEGSDEGSDEIGRGIAR